jgi:hypothetical protein
LRLAGRWEQVIDLDDTDEPAHLELMRRYADGGDRHAALRQFERMDRALRRGLGVAPGEPALRLRNQLLAEHGPAPAGRAPMIGRDPELARARKLLLSTAFGRSRTLLITGPAGVGKSTMVAAIAARAVESGFVVGQGTSAAVEGSWPYAPVVEALGDLCRRHPGLLDGLRVEHRQEIDRALAGAELTWSGASSHQRLFVAATELVRLAAASTGVLLTVDDVHEADDASLRLLHYLARSTRDQRVCLVLAHRRRGRPARWRTPGAACWSGTARRRSSWARSARPTSPRWSSASSRGPPRSCWSRSPRSVAASRSRSASWPDGRRASRSGCRRWTSP